MTADTPRGVSKIPAMLAAIKFEHTVFAMPFALTSMMLAAGGMPSFTVFAWIIAAMVGARSAAMAFNRIADIHYDKLNPRTASRALPSGLLSVADVWAFTLLSSGLFVFAAWKLNPLAFALSPVALLVIFGYSYTKRFTSLSHLILGLALGIAPVGAWIAVTGKFDLAPIILSGAVMLWTAGFDIIYALQDVEFDRRHGLFSIPAAIGVGRALAVSRVFHGLSVVLLAVFGMMLAMGTVYYAGVAFVAILLIYEQSLVKPNDLSRVNTAFFNINGLVSIGYFLFALVDLWLGKAS